MNRRQFYGRRGDIWPAVVWPEGDNASETKTEAHKVDSWSCSVWICVCICMCVKRCMLICMCLCFPAQRKTSCDEKRGRQRLKAIFHMSLCSHCKIVQIWACLFTLMVLCFLMNVIIHPHLLFYSPSFSYHPFSIFSSFYELVLYKSSSVFFCHFIHPSVCLSIS